MATKKNAKPASINATAIGRDIGVNLGVVHGASTATDTIKAHIKTLRDAKIKIGANKQTCAVASAIYDGMPDSLAVATRNQYLSKIRAAVNEGKTFNMNSGRKAGKKTGAKAGNSGTIMIAIKAGDTAEKASETLRKGFEKMRAANDSLAALAAFLVDALDEAAAE